MNEPTTVLTDTLLAALAFVLARRLARSSRCVSGRLWAASFVALAVAAATGGAWHGIPPDVVPSLRYHLWSITYAAIGLADLLILAGAARAVLSSGPRAVALVRGDAAASSRLRPRSVAAARAGSAVAGDGERPVRLPQRRVVFPGFDQDPEIRVSVLPQCEEVLEGSAGVRRVAREC